MSEGSPREKVLTVRKSSYTDEDDDTVNCSINSFAIGFSQPHYIQFDRTEKKL